MASNKVFFLIAVFSTHFSYGGEAQSCTTPDEKIGECISIRECEYLYDYVIKLLQNETISKEESAYAKKSHCGFIGTIPKVCCSNDRHNRRIPDDEMPPDLNFTSLLPSDLECGFYLGSKIRGGRPADLDEFPWMALLTYKLPKSVRRVKQYGCEGFLISKRYILTAAHCLKGTPGSLLDHWKLASVRLGEYNRDSDDDCANYGFSKVCLPSPPIDVKVENYIVHEKFDPYKPHENDIGLIRLDENVNFTDYIMPICLPLQKQEREKTYAGNLLTVSGWGSTENSTHSSVKLAAEVSVKPTNHCTALYKEIDVDLSDKHICAGGDHGKNACPGDSGGPLMAIGQDESDEPHWYAAGIVSAGKRDCGEKNWPAIYVRVTKYIGWIVRNIKQ